MRGRNGKIQILKNGSQSTLRPPKINGVNVYAIRTCPFDSIYQLVAAAVCDWPEFRESVSYKSAPKLASQHSANTKQYFSSKLYF